MFVVIPYGSQGGAVRKVDLVRDRVTMGGNVGSYV